MRDIKLDIIEDNMYEVRCAICGKPANILDSVAGAAFCSEDCRMRWYELYGEVVEKEEREVIN